MKDINSLHNLQNNRIKKIKPQQLEPIENEMKTFTIEELSQYTGKNGNLAYVSINDVVYDVTNSAAWAAGTHFGLKAGNDLTKEFNSCHVPDGYLSGLPVVGYLI